MSKWKLPKKNLLKGESDLFSPSDFNQSELNRGAKIELEHTKSKNVARKIAADHIIEFPNYYDFLEVMEKELRTMPLSWTNQRERQYEHIKEGILSKFYEQAQSGNYSNIERALKRKINLDLIDEDIHKAAKTYAASTVNKTRSRKLELPSQELERELKSRIIKKLLGRK